MDFRLGSARNLLFQTILKYVQKHIVTDIYVGEMEFSSFIFKIEVYLNKKLSCMVRDTHIFAYTVNREIKSCFVIDSNKIESQNLTKIIRVLFHFRPRTPKKFGDDV